MADPELELSRLLRPIDRAVCARHHAGLVVLRIVLAVVPDAGEAQVSEAIAPAFLRLAGGDEPLEVDRLLIGAKDELAVGVCRGQELLRDDAELVGVWLNLLLLEAEEF